MRTASLPSANATDPPPLLPRVAVVAAVPDWLFGRSTSASAPGFCSSARSFSTFSPLGRLNSFFR